MSRESRPVWFLDVDGCVNSWPEPPKDHPYYDEFERIDIIATDLHGITKPIPIWFRPKVITFINSVHDSGRAEVRWLSTWGDQAWLMAPAVGLRHFELAAALPTAWHSAMRDKRSPMWWKLRYLLDDQTVIAPLIFTDDDLTFDSEQALRECFGSDGVLLIAPSDCPGLEDEHLARIDEFLDQHSWGRNANASRSCA